MKMMANHQCKECGCLCTACSTDQDVHLHAEIEQLQQRIAEKNEQIVAMETNFLNEANKLPSGKLLALHDELLMWQDKYKRLHEAHRRVQRVNQGLEDKLLRLVDISETDKSTLTKDVTTLSLQLADANYAIKKLRADNERYKNDVSLAIQLLQCKPTNFVSQRVDTLPSEVQAKVSTLIGARAYKEERRTPPAAKSIKVPIPTFPPTAMVYSVPKVQPPAASPPSPPVHIVSAAIMAKVLEERERERSCIKHCDTCSCSNQSACISIGTQTSAEDRIANGGSDPGGKSALSHHDSIQMAKVQPNNFLRNGREEQPEDALAKSVETIYFANERLQKPIKIAAKSATRVANGCSIAHLHKTLSPGEPPSVSLTGALLEEESAGQSSSSESVSDSLLHAVQEIGADNKPTQPDVHPLDASKYKEMEDHVKKFLFGEYNILGDVNTRSFE